MRETDPIYGYWFFEAYYMSFARQLSVLSAKFVPKTEAQIDELLAFTAVM